MISQNKHGWLIDCHGSNGKDGNHGQSYSGTASGQCAGSSGGNASKSSPGHHAKNFHLKLEVYTEMKDTTEIEPGEITIICDAPGGSIDTLSSSSSSATDIETKFEQFKLVFIPENGLPSTQFASLVNNNNNNTSNKIKIEAFGGTGGNGGNGGNGGHGSRGQDGRNASRYQSGTDGERGFNGGNGGEPSSGSNGGNGGIVTITADLTSKHLLTLIDQTGMNLKGGKGGRRGKPGTGGWGGIGGIGGSSHKTVIYDSQGNVERHEISPGGNNGLNGNLGENGSYGNSQNGDDGEDGQLNFVIQNESFSTPETHSSIWHLRIVSFQIRTKSGSNIVEPGETLYITNIEIENSGGMSLPELQTLQFQFHDFPNWFTLPKGLLPKSIYKLPDSIEMKVLDFDILQPNTEISWLWKTRFEKYPELDTQSFTSPLSRKTKIERSIVITEFEAPNSIHAGQFSQLTFTIKNQSNLSIGKDRALYYRMYLSNTSQILPNQIKYKHTEEGSEFKEFEEKAISRQIQNIFPHDEIIQGFQFWWDESIAPYTKVEFIINVYVGHVDTDDRKRYTPTAVAVKQYTANAAVDSIDTFTCEGDFRKSILLITNASTTSEEYCCWNKLVVQYFRLNLKFWDFSDQGHLDLNWPALAHSTVVLLNTTAPQLGYPFESMNWIAFTENAAKHQIRMIVVQPDNILLLTHPIQSFPINRSQNIPTFNTVESLILFFKNKSNLMNSANFELDTNNQWFSLFRDDIHTQLEKQKTYITSQFQKHFPHYEFQFSGWYENITKGFIQVRLINTKLSRSLSSCSIPNMSIRTDYPLTIQIASKLVHCLNQANQLELLTPPNPEVVGLRQWLDHIPVTEAITNTLIRDILYEVSCSISATASHASCWTKEETIQHFPHLMSFCQWTTVNASTDESWTEKSENIQLVYSLRASVIHLIESSITKSDRWCPWSRQRCLILEVISQYFKTQLILCFGDRRYKTLIKEQYKLVDLGIRLPFINSRKAKQLINNSFIALEEFSPGKYDKKH